MDESENDPMERAPAPLDKEDALRTFKEDHYINTFKNSNKIRFLAIADTIHDFRHGYRAKSLPADGASEANRFLRTAPQALITRTKTNLDLKPRQISVFDTPANYHDIETAIREYFENDANIEWIKPLGDVLTSQVIIDSTDSAEVLANKIREKALAVEIQIDRQHMNNDEHRHKIRDFMIAFLFENAGANCHLTCDAGPNIVKKLVSDSDNVQGLIMPQNMMDSATAGGQELTERPDKYFFPCGSDPLLGVLSGDALGTRSLPDFDKNTGNFGPAASGAGSDELTDKVFQSVANSMTFDNINFYYTGYKTFKNKTSQYGFEQVIRYQALPSGAVAAEPIELKLSLGTNYSSGPSLDMLLGVHIKTKNYKGSGLIDNVRPNGKVLHLTEFINSIEEKDRAALLTYAKAGIQDASGSLFMDIKRAGDWDQCLATFLARDIVENVALVTGDSTCAIRSQTYDNPTIFQFGKIVRLYRSSISAKPLTPTQTNKIKYYSFYNEINNYKDIVKFFYKEKSIRDRQIDEIISMFNSAPEENFNGMLTKIKQEDIKKYLSMLKIDSLESDNPENIVEKPEPTTEDIESIQSSKDKYKEKWNNILTKINISIASTNLVEISHEFLKDIVNAIDSMGSSNTTEVLNTLFNYDREQISKIGKLLEDVIDVNTQIELKGSDNIISIIENYNEKLAIFCNNLMDKKVAFETYNTYQIIFKKDASPLEKEAMEAQDKVEKLRINTVTKVEEKLAKGSGRAVRATRTKTVSTKPTPGKPTADKSTISTISTISTRRQKSASAKKQSDEAEALRKARIESAEATSAAAAAHAELSEASRIANESLAALLSASGSYPNNFFKAVHNADEAFNVYQTAYTNDSKDKNIALKTLENSEVELLKINLDQYDLLKDWKNSDRRRLLEAAVAGAAGAGAVEDPRNFYINFIYPTEGPIQYDFITQKLKEKLQESISALIHEAQNPAKKHKYRIARLAVKPWVNFPTIVENNVLVMENKAAIIAASEATKKGIATAAKLGTLRDAWKTRNPEAAENAERLLMTEAAEMEKKVAEAAAEAEAEGNVNNNNENTNSNNNNANDSFRKPRGGAGAPTTDTGVPMATEGGKRKNYVQYGGGPLSNSFIDQLTDFFRLVSQNVNTIISLALPEVSHYERYLYIVNLIESGDTSKFIKYEMDRFGIFEDPGRPGYIQAVEKPKITNETAYNLMVNMLIGRFERFMNYKEILDEILLSDTMKKELKDFLNKGNNEAYSDIQREKNSELFETVKIALFDNDSTLSITKDKMIESLGKINNEIIRLNNLARDLRATIRTTDNTLGRRTLAITQLNDVMEKIKLIKRRKEPFATYLENKKFGSMMSMPESKVGEKRRLPFSNYTISAKRKQAENNSRITRRNTRSTRDYNKPSAYFNYLNQLINTCIDALYADKMNNIEETVNKTISFHGETLSIFGVEMALAFFFDFISNTSTSYFNIIFDSYPYRKIEFEKTPFKMFIIIENIMTTISKGRYDPRVVTEHMTGGFRKTYKNRKNGKRRSTYRHY